jgi:hypothetical protein
VTVYEAGAYTPERLIQPRSDQEREIIAWLAAHRSGWSSTLVTYVPSRLIKGQDCELNFTRGACILNYRGGWFGAQTQVKRPIDEHDVPQVFDQPPPRH